MTRSTDERTCSCHHSRLARHTIIAAGFCPSEVRTNQSLNLGRHYHVGYRLTLHSEEHRSLIKRNHRIAYTPVSIALSCDP